jgi:hypothetical protein
MENKSDDKFYQYYKSFLQDIIISFPEYKDSIIENHASLLRTNYPVSEKKRAKCNKWRETVFKYCLDNGKLIAEKNSEVFTKEEAKKCLGRNIEFNSIWTSNITESTREQLWNYLQTFYMLAVSDNTDSDLSSLFKNFSETLEGDSTTNEAMMANLKNITENMLETMKDESTELTPKDIEEIGEDTKKMKNEFEGIFKGSIIGDLAENISKELDIEKMFGQGEPQDIIGNLFGGGGDGGPNIMSIVQNIGNTINSKVQSGELDEMKLISEAQNIMGNLQGNDLFSGLTSGLNQAMQQPQQPQQQPQQQQQQQQAPSNPTQERLRKKQQKKSKKPVKKEE